MRFPKSRLRQMAIVGLSLFLFVTASPVEARRSRTRNRSRTRVSRPVDETMSLYYRQGRTISRLSLVDLNTTTILSLPNDSVPERRSDLCADSGHVVWALRNAEKPALLRWNGRTMSSIPIEPNHSFDLDGFSIAGRGDRDEDLGTESKDVFYDDVLLSPDGMKVAWNVNVVTKLTIEDSGTARQKHMIYWADIDGTKRKHALDQDYDVTGIIAENNEVRRLLRWSRLDPASVLFTRFQSGQLVDQYMGLYRASLSSGTVRVLDESLDQVLAVSEDEWLVAHTPNDESCCGHVNQTNNRLLIKDLRTGRETIVFDEWAEFANKSVDDPWTEGHTEEIQPVAADFSPNGMKVAVTLRRTSSNRDVPPRLMTTIREIKPVTKTRFIEDRCVVGWRDNRDVILGECRLQSDEAHIEGTVLFLNTESRAETPLPLMNVVPIGVGR